MATTAVTSLVRTVCVDPGMAVCRSVSASISGTRDYVVDAVSSTVQKSKEVADRTRAVAVGTVKLASRPFVWPVHLSLDLSRRVTVQVLISLREILETLNVLVANLEEQLDYEERRRLTASGQIKTNLLAIEAPPTPAPTQDGPQTPHERLTITAADDDDSQAGQDEGETETTLLPTKGYKVIKKTKVKEEWKKHVAVNRKLKQSNSTLKRRVQVTENKYELMNAQITALRELYQDKMSDMEYDLSSLKQQRNHVMSMIQTAQNMAEDCHGDVQTLMQDLHDLTEQDDGSGADSLSLDLSLEGLTLTSQQRAWKEDAIGDGENDSDTGYAGDDTESSESNSNHRLSLRRVLHRQRQRDAISATSSVTSLDANV